MLSGYTAPADSRPWQGIRSAQHSGHPDRPTDYHGASMKQNCQQVPSPYICTKLRRSDSYKEVLGKRKVQVRHCRCVELLQRQASKNGNVLLTKVQCDQTSCGCQSLLSLESAIIKLLIDTSCHSLWPRQDRNLPAELRARS